MSGKKLQIRDDRGELLRLSKAPERVVSLVPSDTYSIAALGAGGKLVGRTRYCVAPEGEVEGIPIVGGTKDADVDAIVALAPDVVIANQEENTRRDVVRLELAGVRVFVSFPKTVAGGLAHLARLARILSGDEVAPSARALLAEAYKQMGRLEKARSERAPVRVFVPIWMDPLMTIHGDTFISDLLDLVGGANVFSDRQRRYPLAADVGDAEPLPAERVGDRDQRYPRVTLDEVVARQPDVVLLPNEPHAFTEADAAVFRGLDIPAARNGAVHLCDGRDLMWPGARSVAGLDRIASLLETGAARP